MFLNKKSSFYTKFNYTSVPPWEQNHNYTTSDVFRGDSEEAIVPGGIRLLPSPSSVNNIN